MSPKLLICLALISLVDSDLIEDSSLTAFHSFRYCGTGEVCKSPYDEAFNCRCLPQYRCAARSITTEARCTITVGLGYLWKQPEQGQGTFSLDPKEM